jgi:leucyl/phenylalanyl-tRNA---protein transferase
VTVFLLTDDEEAFPPPDLADKSGLLAIGGPLTPRRLMAGYRRGIFPWYSSGQPVLWHSPDPRFVLPAGQLHVPRSLERTLRRAPFTLRADTAFDQVVEACATAPRPGQDGTWITDEVRMAYGELHRLGTAHSVEAWQGSELVGGLYGVTLGSVYFGESMFSHVPDASKVAFATAARVLFAGGCRLIDCQMETAHLARFGAVAWPRRRFLKELAVAVQEPSIDAVFQTLGVS